MPRAAAGCRSSSGRKSRRQRNDIGDLGRNGVSRARFSVDQGHLAEELPGLDHIEDYFAARSSDGRDLHATVEDNHHARALVSLSKDQFAHAVTIQLNSRCEIAKISFR